MAREIFEKILKNSRACVLAEILAGWLVVQ
jgi:hypothetical protein